MEDDGPTNVLLPMDDAIFCRAQHAEIGEVYVELELRHLTNPRAGESVLVTIDRTIAGGGISQVCVPLSELEDIAREKPARCAVVELISGRNLVVDVAWHSSPLVDEKREREIIERAAAEQGYDASELAARWSG